jgi:hypothetical protein
MVGVNEMITPAGHTEEPPAARRSFVLVGTLVARSFGLAAGVALALLGAALFWVP